MNPESSNYSRSNSYPGVFFFQGSDPFFADTSFLGKSDPGQLNPDMQPRIWITLDQHIIYANYMYILLIPKNGLK